MCKIKKFTINKCAVKSNLFKIYYILNAISKRLTHATCSRGSRFTKLDQAISNLVIDQKLVNIIA